MTAQEKIDKDNNQKIIAKKIVEMNYTFNDYEKDFFKFLLDMYHEYIKIMIIKNDQQSPILEIKLTKYLLMINVQIKMDN